MQHLSKLSFFMRKVAVLLAFVGMSGFTFANEEKEFNVSEMIMHHIKDAHEWHLWGPEHGGTSIYLPIILIDGITLIDIMIEKKFGVTTIFPFTFIKFNIMMNFATITTDNTKSMFLPL